MKRLIIMIILITSCFLLGGCVGKKLIEGNNSTITEDEKEISIIDSTDEIVDDNVISDAIEKVKKIEELHYNIEPKVTYDPSNKQGIPDIYGYTKEEIEYKSKILSREQTITNGNYDDKFEPLKESQVYNIGEEVPIDLYISRLTVNKVEIFDNIDSLDKAYFADDRCAGSDFADESGNLKEIIRYENSDGNLEKVSTHLKLLVLDCSLECDAPWVCNIPFSEFWIHNFEKQENGYVTFNVAEAKRRNVDNYYNDFYSVDGNNHFFELLETRPVYFDKAIFTKKAYRSSFYHYYISCNEKVDFRLGYYITSDNIENLYLFYTRNGNNIYTDSILQKAVKLSD